MGSIGCLLVVLAGLWFLANSLLAAKNRGFCKRSLANLRSIASAIEEYRSDHDIYPVGMTVEDLEISLKPEYYMRMPTVGVDYFSDGTTYALFSRWGYEGAFECGCCLEMRDGRFEAWPDILGDERPAGVLLDSN